MTDPKVPPALEALAADAAIKAAEKKERWLWVLAIAFSLVLALLAIGVGGRPW